MQCSCVEGKAGITLRPHTGEEPHLQKTSYCVQQQVREEVRSHQSGAAEQTDGNGRARSPEHSYALGTGDEQSGARF